MIKLTGENLHDFKKKFGIEDEGACINCKKPVIYNEFWYANGYAYARFRHDCPEEYWVTYCIPLGKKQEELRKAFNSVMEN
jgi:hypothetical protein